MPLLSCFIKRLGPRSCLPIYLSSPLFISQPQSFLCLWEKSKFSTLFPVSGCINLFPVFHPSATLLVHLTPHTSYSKTCMNQRSNSHWIRSVPGKLKSCFSSHLIFMKYQHWLIIGTGHIWQSEGRVPFQLLYFFEI